MEPSPPRAPPIAVGGAAVPQTRRPGPVERDVCSWRPLTLRRSYGPKARAMATHPPSLDLFVPRRGVVGRAPRFESKASPGLDGGARGCGGATSECHRAPEGHRARCVRTLRAGVVRRRGPPHSRAKVEVFVMALRGLPAPSRPPPQQRQQHQVGRSRRSRSPLGRHGGSFKRRDVLSALHVAFGRMV